jgi:hypothetical protein
MLGHPFFVDRLFGQIFVNFAKAVYDRQEMKQDADGGYE